MPTNYRAQIVAQWKTTDVSRDFCTNVLWYASNTTAASAIGDALKTAFTNTPNGVYQGCHLVTVKMYDHANPLHSPPVYTTSFTGPGNATMAPRQLALCLSFFSGLNVRGQRGRIYIGPWDISQVNEYASTAVMTQMMILAGSLRTPGGADVVHMIHHPKSDSFSNVSNYFVNNRWDTMRSRLPKETARQTLP